jgi:hypothetical protein
LSATDEKAGSGFGGGAVLTSVLALGIRSIILKLILSYLTHVTPVIGRNPMNFLSINIKLNILRWLPGAAKSLCSRWQQRSQFSGTEYCQKSVKRAVASVGDPDPEPDPQDPLVFGPSEPGSISQMSVSVSFPFLKGVEWTEIMLAK